jgi:hypothetical protein
LALSRSWLHSLPWEPEFIEQIVASKILHTV